MRRFLLTSLLFILSTVFAFGQKTIKGKILNEATKDPIPYANIGVINSNVGTISNFDGSFSIIIPQKLIHDSLTFSSLGFFKKTMALSILETRKDYTILLNEKATILGPVVILAKKLREKLVVLGNRSYDGGNYEPDTTYAGRAVALLITNKDFSKKSVVPIYLRKANLAIFRNNLESFKFRIRINKYDSLTGKPGEDLLDKSIVLESFWKSGWVTFDLTQLNFRVTGPFFVTFEQLVDLRERTDIAMGFRKIMRTHPEWYQTDTVEFEGKKQITQKLLMGGIDLPGTFIGSTYSKSAIAKYPCFVRKTSLAEWVQVPMVIGATVELSGLFKTTTSETPIIPPLGN